MRDIETLELAVNTEWQKQKEYKQRGQRGEDIEQDTRNNFAQMSASTVMKCTWFVLCPEIERKPQHQKVTETKTTTKDAQRAAFCQ